MPVAAGGNLGPAALALPLLPHMGCTCWKCPPTCWSDSRPCVSMRRSCSISAADHLDRHGDMAGYAGAKRAIFDRQTGARTAVVGIDDALSRDMADRCGRPAKW